MASLFQNNTAFTNVIKFTACPGNCPDLYSNVKRNEAWAWRQAQPNTVLLST